MNLLKFAFLFVVLEKVNSQAPSSKSLNSDCVVYDSTHIKTFDGEVFSVASTCSYTLVKVNSNKNIPVEINYLKNPNSIQILLGGVDYRVSIDGNGKAVFTANGVPMDIDKAVNGILVSQPGSLAIIELKRYGIKIRYDGNMVEVIQDNSIQTGIPVGLCGNNDGSAGNDRLLTDGSLTTSSIAWANSWALNGCTATNFISRCVTSPSMIVAATAYCTDLLSRPVFTGCSSFTQEYSTICQSNYCSCRKPTKEECQCEMLDSFTRACQTKNDNIMDWRSFGLCKITCPNPDQQYLNCAPNHKQLSCWDHPETNPNDIDCEEGCYCPAGQRWYKEKCLLLSECPCILDGEIFQPGQTGTHECNDCTCRNGGWACPDKKSCCCKRAGCVGDPHYTTFDDLKYNFMGKCDYYVLRSFFGDVICRHFVRTPQQVFVRNYQSTAPSFCTEVLVIVEGHIIKIAQKKVTHFDNRLVKSFPYVRDGIRVVDRDGQFITVILRNNVEVQFDGNWNVYVQVPNRMANRVEGLFGTFSYSTADDLLKSDGTLASTIEDFGNSWTVPDSCENENLSPVVNPCIGNPTKQAAAEQFCGVLLAPIFDGCSDTRQSDYEDCVYDGCLCPDNDLTCLCGMYTHQAKKCAAKKITVNWRPSVPQCPLTCPAGQEAQLCVNHCIRTCADIPLNTECDITKDGCEEGCACPTGQALNDKNQCIPISQCPCIYEGHRFPGGFTFVIEDTALRYDCVNALWVITTATAKNIRDYPSIEQFNVECPTEDAKGYAGCKRVNTLTCYNNHLEEEGEYDNCVAGCECLPGFVLDTALGICVRPEQCPCVYKGISYPDGSEISNREEKCSCVDGEWVCVTETDHWEMCSVWGDIHVRTFDETFFSFQGTCEYVMLQYDFGTSGSFRVSVETGYCNTGTCIIAAYIRFRAENGNIDNVVFTPGQSYVASPNLQNLVITDLGASVMVDVVAFGTRVIWGIDGWVHIHLASNWLTWPFYGLCGIYDNNPTNDLQVSGQTINGVPDFVDYNRLDNMCDPSSSLLLDDIIIPNRCDYIFDDIFKSCNLLVPPEEYYDKCVINAQKQANLDPALRTVSYCSTFAAYAQECANAGEPVNWRTSEICSLPCGSGEEYYSCDTPCPRKSCANTGCADKVCAESCNIPECQNGQVYFDATNSACVDPATCPVLRRRF